jgi:hypothetical protein
VVRRIWSKRRPCVKHTVGCLRSFAKCRSTYRRHASWIRTRFGESVFTMR